MVKLKKTLAHTEILVDSQGPGTCLARPLGSLRASDFSLRAMAAISESEDVEMAAAPARGPASTAPE